MAKKDEMQRYLRCSREFPLAHWTNNCAEKKSWSKQVTIDYISRHLMQRMFWHFPLCLEILILAEASKIASKMVLSSFCCVENTWDQCASHMNVVLLAAIYTNRTLENGLLFRNGKLGLRCCCFPFGISKYLWSVLDLVDWKVALKKLTEIINFCHLCYHKNTHHTRLRRARLTPRDN